MSNFLVGDTKSLKVNDINIFGRPGQPGQVGVEILSLVNRETKSSQLKKYLKNGFDWSKFTPPTIAVFPNGDEYLLDGDHRRGMYRVVFPNRTKMPCYRIDVKNEQEYHKLFYEVNWSNRKSANKDEVFVHQVLAQDQKALEIKNQLVYTGLSVYGSPDEFGTVGAPNSKRISVGAFNRCVKHGLANVKLASELLDRAWSNDEKIQGELLEGTTLLFKLHPSFNDGSAVDKDFKLWFSTYVAIHTQYNAASDYKTKGGRVHHKHGESIAHGLIVDYRRVTVPNGCSLKHKQRIVKLNKTSNLLN